MHHIQRKILNLLMHAPSLSYAQLRPKGMESNHFAYHLEQLKKAGLIEKQTGAYSLTTEGMAYADRVSHETMTVRKQPHIVTTLCITNDAGQMLLFKHAFQPYMDLIGFPQGRMHYGETVTSAAARELFEKAGLEGVSLAHRGIIYITAIKDGQDISRLLTHVFTGSVTGAPSVVSADTTKGTSFWGDPAGYVATQHMPGVGRIRQLLAEAQGLFFDEVTVEMV